MQEFLLSYPRAWYAMLLSDCSHGGRNQSSPKSVRFFPLSSRHEGVTVGTPKCRLQGVGSREVGRRPAVQNRPRRMPHRFGAMVPGWIAALALLRLLKGLCDRAGRARA